MRRDRGRFRWDITIGESRQELSSEHVVIVKFNGEFEREISLRNTLMLQMLDNEIQLHIDCGSRVTVIGRRHLKWR